MGRREDIIKGIKKFKTSLNQQMHVEKMILFGSYAKGTFNSDSDVDLIIVSPKFSDLQFSKRALGFYKFWPLRLPVDFICFSPSEFNRLKRTVSLVSEALQNGIEIN